MTGETSETGRCSFSIDVSQWNEAHEIDDGPGIELRFLDEDGYWTCNRRVRAGDDYCLFHDHASDDSVESAAKPGQVLRDIVNENTDDRSWNRDEPEGLWEVPNDEGYDRDEFKRREKQFLGASLGTVRLSNERLDGSDSYPIDLRLADAKEIDLSGTRIGHPLELSGVQQPPKVGGLDLHNCQCDRIIRMEAADIAGDINIKALEAVSLILDNSETEGSISGSYIETKDLQLRGITVTGGDVLITDSGIDDSVFLEDATVSGRVSLDRSDIGYQIYLDNLSSENTVSLNYTTAEGVKAEDIEVSGDVSFKSTKISDRTTVSFAGARVGEAVEFDNARIETSVNLDLQRVDDSVSITGSELSDSVTIGTADRIGDSLQVEGSTINGSLVIEHETVISRQFTLRQTEITDSVEIKSGTQIDGAAVIDAARVHEAIVVNDGTTVGGRLAIKRSTTQELVVGCRLTHPAVTAVSLTDSTITGEVQLRARTGADQNAPVHDLARATIGEVDLDLQSADAKPFEHLRFLETTFDGFVFSRKRPELRETGWTIHSPRTNGYRDIAIATQQFETEDRPPRPAIEVARDIVAALVTGAVTNILDELDAPADEAVDGDQPITELALRNLSRSLFDDCRQDLEAYEQAAFRPADDADAQSVRGDPLSRVHSWFVGRTVNGTPDEGRDAADRQARDLWEATHESIDFPRLRRVITRDERVTRQCERHRDRLRTAIDTPVSPDGQPLVSQDEKAAGQPEADPDPDLVSEKVGDEHAGTPLSQSMVPDTFEISGGTASAADVERAIAHTLAQSPALVRDLVELNEHAEEVTPPHHADGPVSEPVARVLREWDIADDSPLIPAIRGTSEAILDFAAAIEKDHQRLVSEQERYGLAYGISDTPEQIPKDGVHPYSAIADTILHPAAVEKAETIVDQLEAGRIDPRQAGIEETVIEQLETSIATELVEVERVRPTDDEVESTYAEGKNGASAAGDETTAGHFFQLEGKFARRQHWQRWKREYRDASGWVKPLSSVLLVLFGAALLTLASLGGSVPTALSSDVATGPLVVALSPEVATLLGVGGIGAGVVVGREPFGSLFQWLGNIFLWLTMGYGEQPLRVLCFSGAVVTVFAGLYWTGEQTFAAGPSIAGGFINYLSFSLEMFVTLFLGTPQVDHEWVRLAAAIEGFVGVFVIGMFVVTVTRAIHR